MFHSHTIRPQHQRGFTLIELMIVVAVVAILSAIAVPSYRAYLQRAGRSDARTVLVQAAQWMERASTAAGSYPALAAIPGEYQGNATVPGGRYTLDVVRTTTTFTFTATPTGSQTGDECGSFTLTHAGEKNVVSATLTKEECWTR